MFNFLAKFSSGSELLSRINCVTIFFRFLTFNMQIKYWKTTKASKKAKNEEIERRKREGGGREEEWESDLEKIKKKNRRKIRKEKNTYFWFIYISIRFVPCSILHIIIECVLNTVACAFQPATAAAAVYSMKIQKKHRNRFSHYDWK